MSETTSRMNYTYPSRDQDPWYEDFQSLVNAIDSSTFAHREDRSLVFAGGGTLSWTVATSTLVWTDTIRVASTISGRQITVSANSAVLNEGQILYLELTRQPLQNVSTSFLVGDQLPSSNNACAVAVRIGGVVFFRTGISLTDGMTSPGIAPVPSAGGGGPGSDTTAIHDNQAGEIAAIAPKATPTTSDIMLIENAAAGNAKARITLGDLPPITPAIHALGGAQHSSSTLAAVNNLISDATLDGVGDPRTDNAAIHDNVAGEIVAITSKGTPTTSDILLIEDIADGNNKKSITVGSLPGGTPSAHASTHEPGGGDPLTVDAVGATGSLRTLGTGAQQACAGNDSRLSDARTPTSHASTHEPGGGDAMAVDAVAATGSLRTLGTGAQQACAGNDSRLSDARTPTSHASTHEPGGGDAMAVDAVAATGSLRTLGTGAQQACAGNDARLSDARTPTSHNTSHQSGGGDAIKLDDLAPADDNTDLDSTISAHGLLPKLAGGTTNFLRADGTWAAPAGGGGDATSLQGTDIDSALSPVDGQVLTYDGSGAQWIAASPAEGTSYLEMGQNHTITSAGGSPDSEDVGRAIFDASQHNSITFRAILNSAYATTGSSSVKLYDDGSLTTPGTPRLVTTFTQTDDTLTYEVFEQALTVVAGSPTTNQILGEGRVYRVVVEITATSSDTTTVSTVGFAAVGNGDVVTLSADMVQAIAMSLNA